MLSTVQSPRNYEGDPLPFAYVATSQDGQFVQVAATLTRLLRLITDEERNAAYFTIIVFREGGRPIQGGIIQRSHVVPANVYSCEGRHSYRIWRPSEEVPPHWWGEPIDVTE